MASITISDDRSASPLPRIWRYIGYDEPNYTYSIRGADLLNSIGSLPDGPYFIRCHFLLCSGDGQPRLKWGSTGVYEEDSDGNPVFFWDVIDRIFDTIVRAGCLPFVELGFMPKALSSAPETVPYEGASLSNAWSYPPSDYSKWEALIRELGAHVADRYGRACVRQWYWELWNEPDIGYWSGSPEEYCRLFDSTERALHGILPFAYLGGPGTTNPGNTNAGAFLRTFLEHCQSGTRLDFISFHAKGGHYSKQPDDQKRTPTIAGLLAHIQAGVDIVDEFSSYGGHEIILSECDPDGWAAGTISDNPNLFYRNTEYYASYVAAAACELVGFRRPELRTLSRARRIDGLLTWAFYFDDRKLFEGLRALSTNGIEKPAFNVFRLLSRMAGSLCGVLVDSGPDDGVRCIASQDGQGGYTVFICAHRDDWDAEATVEVELRLPGGCSGTAHVWRVDREHGNSYTAWKGMGAPATVDEEDRGKLRRACEPRRENVDIIESADGTCAVNLTLLPHSIMLLETSSQNS